MAAIITYNGNTIHESTRTESFTLLTNNLIMKSDIVIYVDEETKAEVTYNGELLNLNTDPGEHTYNLLCANKLMLSNLTVSIEIEGSISYDSVDIYTTSSDSITLPNTSNIMIVLIGGGTGGQGGYNGKKGSQPVSSGGTSYTYYELLSNPNDTVVYETSRYSTWTIAPYAMYKDVGLDTTTGKFNYSEQLNSAISATITSNQFLDYVRNGYKIYKKNTTSHRLLRIDNGDIKGVLYTSEARTGYSGGILKYDSYTPGGEGGNGGSGGSGGKIFKKELTISQTTAKIVIGNGGAAGASNGKYGSAGANTTITIGDITYSSKDGIYLPDGFKNTVGVDDPVIYGAQGIDGIKGGSGGGYNLYYNSEVGESIIYGGETYAGGAIGTNKIDGSNTIGGGSGGGAAVGHDGDSGGNAITARTGGKGDGADAGSTLAAFAEGCGGNGGHGGGGGGNSGGSQKSGVVSMSEGKGGSGGAGSAGANGIVLIYYNSGE